MLKFKDILGKLSWSSVASVAYILIQAFVFFYLTHHLSTTVFGVFSIAVSLILFGLNIIENGLPQSIIQTHNPKEEDYNTVLYLNLKTAFYYAFTISIVLLFYTFFSKTSGFIFPTIFLLPCLFLSAYNKVQLVGLQKDLKFKCIAKVEIFSSCAYLIAVAITLFFNLGIWILVISFAVKYVATFVLLHFSNYKYSNKLFSRNENKIGQHWDFGKYIQGEKVITSIISYADVFIITATLGVEILGFYDVLKRIVLRPIILLYNGAEQLFYPLFVKSKSETHVFIHNYRILNRLSSYGFINVTAIIFVCSPLIIQWLPNSYAEYLSTLKLLCVFSAVVVVLNPIDILLYSLGKSKQFFNWILSYTIPLLLIIFFTSRLGLDSLLIGLIGFYSVLYMISYFVLIRKTFIPAREYFQVFVYTTGVFLVLNLL